MFECQNHRDRPSTKMVHIGPGNGNDIIYLLCDDCAKQINEDHAKFLKENKTNG